MRRDIEMRPPFEVRACAISDWTMWAIHRGTVCGALMVADSWYLLDGQYALTEGSDHA